MTREEIREANERVGRARAEITEAEQQIVQAVRRILADLRLDALKKIADDAERAAQRAVQEGAVDSPGTPLNEKLHYLIGNAGGLRDRCTTIRRRAAFATEP